MLDRKKLIAVVAAAAVLTLGAGTAVVAQQGQEDETPIKGGSVTAPAGSDVENEANENEADENEADEANESQGLDRLTKIDQGAAEEAALGAVPGEVQETELEDENGFVVYEVEVAGDDGKLHEVVVDAGNGKVLAQETEENED